MALSGSTNKTFTPSAAFWVWVEWTATQNVENNTSTITAITYGGSNSYGYYSGTNKWGYTTIAGNTTSVKYTAPWAASTTKKELHRQVRTIAHNADGTKTADISGRWTAGSDPEGSFFDITSSGSFTLDTIPRATQPTVNLSTVPLGSAVTISTPRASDSFTHILKYAVGAQTGTIATGVGTSHAWTPPATLAAGFPAATSGAVVITCETYSGATLIGSKTVSTLLAIPTMSPARDPYMPAAAIASVIEGATGLTAFTVFIQGKSKLRVQSSGTGKYGVTITQYKVTIDGYNYYGVDITSALIGKSGTIAVTLVVTDSRGYTTTVSQNVTLQPYTAPVITTFTASRAPTDQGTDLSVPINFSISALSNQNTKFYQIRYRPSGGSWTVLTSSTAYYTRSITHTGSGVLNTTLAYEVEFTVADYFTSVVRTLAISTAFDLINFNASGKGIAFGRVSGSDAFEVDMPTTFYEGVTSQGGGNVSPKGRIYSASNGILIDICDANLYNMITVHVKGNGYGAYPINTIFQTYHNTPLGTFVNSKQTNYGTTLAAGKFLIDGSRVKLWFPQSASYQTIIAEAYGMNGAIYSPLITNAVEPAVTYKSTCLVGGLTLPEHMHSSLTGTTTNYSYTDFGYISFGPQNATWAHIYTDRPSFYFNKDLYVNGFKARTIVARSGDAKNGYEKYNDGYARAWKTVSTTVLAASMTATGPSGTYKSGWIAIGTWPITFTSAPRSNATLAVTASAWTWLGSLKAPTTTDAGEFLIYKFAQSDSALELYIEGYGPA